MNLDEFKQVFWLSHKERCLIQGCYYGTDKADNCRYCGCHRAHETWQICGRSVIDDALKAAKR